MAIPVSSLSVAVQGIADFLDGQFGEDVAIITDTPQKASEKAKAATTKHYLNLFFYRITPSEFNASAAADDVLYVRINALLTPFLNEQDTSVVDADLRILGHAMRVFHSTPVLPNIFPDSSVDPLDFRSGPHVDYRLQSVMQSPTMEELNHIWTTQGGELAYRISIAYEFSLIPIEPLTHRIDAGPVTTSILDIQPNIDAKDEEAFIPYGDDVSEIPLGGIGIDNPVTDWLPVVLFSDGDGLSNSKVILADESIVNLAIAGPVGERVALEVKWDREDGTKDIQAAEIFTIASSRIDDPIAVNSLALDSSSNGDIATVLTRPVDETDLPILTSAFANTLSLSVGVI